MGIWNFIDRLTARGSPAMPVSGLLAGLSLTMLLAFALGCSSSSGGSEGGGEQADADTRLIGGILEGLHDGTVQLVLNGEESTGFSEDGSFVFDTELEVGEDYEVTIGEQPEGPMEQTCELSNASGTVGDGDVDDILVRCPLRPWMARQHYGDLSAGNHVIAVSAEWPSDPDSDYILYMSTDPEADFLEPGTWGIQAALNAMPGHRFEGLSKGVPVYMALEVDGRIEAWTAAKPNLYGAEQARGQVVDPATGIHYFSGNFDRLVTPTGMGVTFPSASTGVKHPLAFPEVIGTRIEVAIPDGEGGWYLGGTFDYVGGQPRENLAHVDAQDRVTDWDPGADHRVNSMLRYGNVIYVGGRFGQVGHGTSGGGEQSRMGLAAFDTDGAVTAWDPGVDDRVYDLVVMNDRIYAVGRFEEAGSGTTGGGVQTRSYLAAFDTDGALLDWNPGADDRVESLAAADGIIYAGGRFNEAGTNSTERLHLAAFDESGGLTDWDPGANSRVETLVLHDDVIYVGGAMTEMGLGESSELVDRDRLGAVNLDGEVLDWNPGVDGGVLSLTVMDDLIYAAGTFGLAGHGSTGGGERPQEHLVAIDTSGEVIDWNPGLDSTVRAVAHGNGVLFAGGNFAAAGLTLGTGFSLERHGTAAVDANGVPTDWDPGVDSAVLSMVLHDGVIYGGGFEMWQAGMGSSHSGEPLDRQGVVAFDLDGNVTDWDPGVRNLGAQTIVYDLLMHDGILYVAGRFQRAGNGTSDNEVERQKLAAFDVDGKVMDWDPGADAWPQAIAYHDGVIYVGGRFEQVGMGSTGDETVDRQTLAAVNLDGEVLDWDPGIDRSSFADPYVSGIAIMEDVIYVGGNFDTAGMGTTGGGTETRANLAAIDTAGELLDWDPGLGGWVHAMAQHNDRIYVVGQISNAGSGASASETVSRDGIAAFNADGTVNSWDPGLDGQARNIIVHNDVLYVGGNFDVAGVGDSALPQGRVGLVRLSEDGNILPLP